MESLEHLYRLFLECNSITTDSRKCNQGSIFFALKGDRFDGNQYALETLKNGCSLAVVDDKSLKGYPGIFYVSSVLNTLQDLAQLHRKNLGIPIVGITGTNGKTTTKELIASVLMQKLNVQYTRGNLNNHIGVPLTLLSMNQNTQIGVVEMGANHIGEIDALCRIADPDVGIITNIGRAHIEGFGSYEGVIEAKGELYRYMRSKGGRVVVNADDELLMQMCEGMERLTYGALKDRNTDVYGGEATSNPFLLFHWGIRGGGVNSVSTRLVGKYNLYNALAAICTGRLFGISEEAISRAIEDYRPENNRSQLIETTRNKVLMDAYNANPSSMQVALDNFLEIPGTTKVMILGGMKELGAVSDQEHQKLIERIERSVTEQVILVGEEFRNVNKDLRWQWFQSTDDLIRYLQQVALTGKLILIKGSRGNQLERLLPLL